MCNLKQAKVFLRGELFIMARPSNATKQQLISIWPTKSSSSLATRARPPNLGAARLEAKRVITLRVLITYSEVCFGRNNQQRCCISGNGRRGSPRPLSSETPLLISRSNQIGVRGGKFFSPPSSQISNRFLSFL